MMATSGMNPRGGRDTAGAVARQTAEAIIDGRLEIVRGGAERLEMVRRNRTEPAAVDEAMATWRPSNDTVIGSLAPNPLPLTDTVVLAPAARPGDWSSSGSLVVSPEGSVTSTTLAPAASGPALASVAVRLSGDAV